MYLKTLIHNSSYTNALGPIGTVGNVGTVQITVTVGSVVPVGK
jgi:hypothetical protein